MQNSAKINRSRQSENVFGSYSFQAPSCVQFYPKIVIFRRKVQIFVGGQNELTLVTLLQNRLKIHQY